MNLTIDEAAVQLGKSVRQVRYLIEQGKLPASKAGGRWRIDSRALPRGKAQQSAKERKTRGLQSAVEAALDLPEEPQRRYSVTDLKAFQLALPLYQESCRELGAEHPAALELRRVLLLLTQGCHRFNRTEKADAYREARDAASSAVCELVLAGDGTVREIREAIEQELMATLAGLLRRLDRKGSRR